MINIKKLNTKEIANEILKGNTTILSRLITFLESTKKEHNNIAQKVLVMLEKYSGKSIRIGITGIPGVGKSTFIESLVKHLLPQNKKIAILAIDPTSQKNKGSILGDKTRMEEISREENVFIRPSPAGKQLGGVNRKTRETIILCEACGFDTILIETVGVGQSEIAVNYMVDCFILLMLASAGDELQGIKKGIMEMVDILVINKSEEKNIDKTRKAILNYKNALHLFQEKESKWQPIVTSCSSLNNNKINEVWNEIQKFFIHINKNNFYKINRNKQSYFWVKEIINNTLINEFYNNTLVKKEFNNVNRLISNNNISSIEAAESLLNLYKKVSRET